MSLQIGGLFTGQPLQCCGTCEGLGRITCSRCKGAGMANSWLWRTDMSRPSGKHSDDVDADGSEDGSAVHAGRKQSLPEQASGNGQPASEFPYPGLGYTKQTFRERVREQRERRQVKK
jgi:hypothetical protein